jgi:hypothetical protein
MLIYTYIHLHLFTGFMYLSCLVDSSMFWNAYLYLILSMSICWLGLAMLYGGFYFFKCLSYVLLLTSIYWLGVLATSYKTPICLGCLSQGLFYALLYSL